MKPSLLPVAAIFALTTSGVCSVCCRYSVGNCPLGSEDTDKREPAPYVPRGVLVERLNCCCSAPTLEECPRGPCNVSSSSKAGSVAYIELRLHVENSPHWFAHNIIVAAT